MKKILKTFLLILIVYSCGPGTQQNYNSLKTLNPVNNNTDKEFLITDKSIGWATLGQSIEQFKMNYKNFKIDTVPVWDFGVDGGGTGFLISKESEALIFAWALFDSSTLYCISALSPRFSTKYGLKPGMSVGELKKHFPKMRVSNNLEWPGLEVFRDNQTGFTFEFVSSDTTSVGFYPNLNNESEPIDTSKKVTRITIYR